MVIGLLVFLLLFWQAKTRTMKLICALMDIILGLFVFWLGVGLVGNSLLAKHNLPGQYAKLEEMQERLDQLDTNNALTDAEELYSFAEEYKKVSVEIDSLKASIEEKEHYLPSNPGFWRAMKVWIGFDPRVFIK